MADGAQTDPSLNKVEHLDENISAKRVVIYAWDGSNNQRLLVDGSGNLKVVSSGGGGGAVTIADGADVTLGAKADAKSTATDTTPITLVQILKQISASVQAPPSQAVTNAGTFVVQATLAVETTKVIGTVNQGTSPWVTNDPGIPDTLGQKAMAASTGVVIASDQSAIPVTGTFFQTTQPVSLATNTPDVTDRSARLLGHVTIDNASIAVTGAFFQGTQPVSVAATVVTKETRSTTPAQTSPSVGNTNTSILALNVNRLGATIYNEGTAICYMILGSTATTTSYTLQIAVGGYYELPFGYTGAVAGITSASTAQLRVTELT